MFDWVTSHMFTVSFTSWSPVKWRPLKASCTNYETQVGQGWFHFTIKYLSIIKDHGTLILFYNGWKWVSALLYTSGTCATILKTGLSIHTHFTAPWQFSYFLLCWDSQMDFCSMVYLQFTKIASVDAALLWTYGKWNGHSKNWLVKVKSI